MGIFWKITLKKSVCIALKYHEYSSCLFKLSGNRDSCWNIFILNTFFGPAQKHLIHYENSQSYWTNTFLTFLRYVFKLNNHMSSNSQMEKSIILCLNCNDFKCFQNYKSTSFYGQSYRCLFLSSKIWECEWPFNIIILQSLI